MYPRDVDIIKVEWSCLMTDHPSIKKVLILQILHVCMKGS
jgi:hypothetical protein